MSTPDTLSEMEARLRAALAARAELVRTEDLSPLAPVVGLRPRWRSPWVVLATAAVVLLVLGVVLQGVTGRQRSDDVAPRPDERVELEVPADIGRGWDAQPYSTPARLDLDGDGRKETVDFLGEPGKRGDGRVRMQTTLSSTGEEAWGIADVGTTTVSALPPVDADENGDQELVLYRDDAVGGSHPLVYDLRDGLLLRAVVDQPELLVRGDLPVPGSSAEHYEQVRQHDYWIEDGTLWSSRSVNAYAHASMTIIKPLVTVWDAWTWRLSEDGRLEPVDAGCIRHDVMDDSRTPCEDGAVDDLPDVADAATATIGVGESAAFEDGFPFTARLVAGADPSLVIDGSDGRTISHGLEVGDPRVATVQPVGIFSDGASVLVTSAADPSYVRVLRQDGDRLLELAPVGEVDLTDDGTHRTWLTTDGTLVTAVAGPGEAWRLWFWLMVSPTEMAALPGAEVCFDDVDDPATVRAC